MSFFFFFFFNDTATTEIYTLSLHDALPISPRGAATAGRHVDPPLRPPSPDPQLRAGAHLLRSVESELDGLQRPVDRKSTRLNSSHSQISYAVFCLKKKNPHTHHNFLVPSSQ